MQITKYRMGGRRIQQRGDKGQTGEKSRFGLESIEAVVEGAVCDNPNCSLHYLRPNSKRISTSGMMATKICIGQCFTVP